MSYRALQLPQATAWKVVSLTLAFSFTLEGKTIPVAEELVDASAGTARHKHWLGEPDEHVLMGERQTGSAHLIIQLVWLPGAGMRSEAEPGLGKSSVVHQPHPPGAREESDDMKAMCLHPRWGPNSLVARDAEAPRGKGIGS